jgi:LacI family transcriptional regulator
MASTTKAVKTKKPTMYDVARLAGVSQTTVSFVVNDAPNATIPQETRDRIWAAIKELGWRPNALARGLSLQRTHTIGFISDEIATTPHAVKAIQGAQDAAWAADKLLLVINTGRNLDLERDAIEMMLERQVDAFIYATMYHRPVTVPPNITQVPVVLIDCYVEDRSLPSVVPDEVQGGRTATEVLLQKGQRRIGFINNVDAIPATAGRLEGYRQALAAAGIPFDADLVRIETVSAASGYRATLALMQLPDPPTALFCFNDIMAMGAYDALRTLGQAIPEDVAVVGFDNLELIAAQLHPSLSTMELPYYQMGQWGVQYLLEHADGTLPPAPLQHKLRCPFIPRFSV